MRPHQHAVAAGFVGRLHHQLGQVLQHILAVVVAPAQIRRHVRQDRILALVIADHVRHVGVDHLVVGHAVARRVGQRHPPVRDTRRSVPARPAANPRGTRRDPENRRRCGGRSRPRVRRPLVVRMKTASSSHHQVAALHQLDAHLLRQKAVLEVGGVVDAGRQQHHARACRPRRAARSIPASPAAGWDIRSPAAPQPFEHLRKDALQHLAVFEHVGHARGHAQVVFQHVDTAVAVAHQVGAGDVAPDSAAADSARGTAAGRTRPSG